MNDDKRQQILKTIEEHKVRFIQLQFSDILGIIKSVSIPTSQIEKALDGDIMFDGSSIGGFVRIDESDMYLKPDLDTFNILPWRDFEDGVTARFVCDVYGADNKPFEGCPRYNLQRIMDEAASLGFSLAVGPECEFFFFQRCSEGEPTLLTQDRAGYFDLDPVDKGGRARGQIVLALEEMGLELEASHHEVAAGQHEVDFKYAGALRTADNTQTLKWVTKVVARDNGLHATFMPKPLFGCNGSGMHTNLSLFRGEDNAFFDPKAEHQLSDTALHFIAGLIEHARAYVAVTNPLVNSYKRLVPGYEAPVYCAWSRLNRSAFIRIPARRGVSTRCELRCPDPSTNPYLAFAVVLAAGLDGVKRKLEVPDATDMNIFEMTEQQRADRGIRTLPGTLWEAVEELKKDKVIRKALGDHIFRKYVEAKEKESGAYRTRVHKWETDEYLQLY